MRYSIIDATVQQVSGVGGTNIRDARRTGIIFADLSKAQAVKLEAMGCEVVEVGGVAAAVLSPIVAPPRPVEALPTYTMEQLALASGTGW